MRIIYSIFVILLSFTLQFAYANKTSNSPILVQHDIKHDISKPLRDAPNETIWDKLTPIEMVVPLYSIPVHEKPITGITDTALQLTKPKTLTLPFESFTGLGIGLGNYYPSLTPPDTNGAAGTYQYVQVVNTDIAVFDKNSGAIAPGFPKRLTSLWSGFGGPCETRYSVDPIVKYDQLANRWIVTTLSYTTSTQPPFFQCVAVSTSSDATGSYYRYAFQFNMLNDYGKLAVWPNGYYLTLNLIGNVWQPTACVFNRSAMLSGQPTTMQCLPVPGGQNLGTVLPADLDGSILPPSYSPGYLLAFQAPNSLKFYQFYVDFQNTNNTHIVGPINIPVANFTIACPSVYGRACLPQPNTSTLMDSLGDRMMYRLAYRHFADNHGAMVATHSVQASNAASAIRWYELRFLNGQTIPILYQQGTFSPDTLNRSMGSIAMDKNGNILVGYTVSSAYFYPSIEVSGRIPSDPLGLLTVSQRVINGNGSQTGITRWGDYSAMAIDPVDDCTFWYTTEYLTYTGSYNWSSIIASTKLGCN